MTQPPPLKTDPKYGYYPRWPQDDDAWVHPEDVELARRLIPSQRIFCRDGMHGPFHMLHYGDVSLRVKPALWIEVEPEGLAIGDWVEVLSRGAQNTPRTGRICEMLWDDHDKAIQYQIDQQDHPVVEFYKREDLRPVEPTPELSDVEEVRIEPRDDGGEELEIGNDERPMPNAE